MTYEFTAGDSIANDVPNPYKIENVFLLVASLGLAGAAVSVLMAARTYFQGEDLKLAGATLLLATVLLGASAKFLIQALSHLRFFLGRKHPRGLATELATHKFGLGKGAEKVMETMRDGSIEFPEPHGALNGLLYTIIKPLITAPPPLQVAAVQHFHALVGMIALLLSMLVSYIFAAGSEYEGVVSWFYLPLSGLSIASPFLKKAKQTTDANKAVDSNAMMWKLFGLIVFAVVGPVAIPHHLPAYHVPPMWIAPALMVATSAVASIMFLGSLFSKLDDVAQTSVSCERALVSMNCHPAQLWMKLSSDFQTQWVRNIPNRAYANVPPGATASDRDRFQGYILEETQPTPFNNIGEDSARQAIKDKHTRWLIALSVWGMFVSLAGAAVAAFFAPQFDEMEMMEVSRIILITIALTATATLAFQIGHMLWSRMYFKSRLVLVAFEGTYHDAELRVGNQFTGNMQSRSTITRIEDANLRVWVTDIVSVTFGKEEKRFIMAMAPADGYAQSTMAGLREFASNQSSIAMPTAPADLQRAKAVVAMGQEVGNTADMSALDHFMSKHAITTRRTVES